MIWFTSDTHYNHKNIVRGTTEWKEGDKDHGAQSTRDFKTLEEHNEQLIKRINFAVMPDDTLYHLGDWSFGGFRSIRDFREQLNCREIHLIYGNHDHHIEANKEGVQSLFSSVQYYKEVNVLGQRICMSHYAMRVWNKSHHGSWMLYGHSHGSLERYYHNAPTMDVGVDDNNLYPYSMDELRILFARTKPLVIDHHNKRTN